MVKPKTIRFDPHQLQAVRDFCEITGTSVEAALHEALEDWLECCMPPMLEEFVQRSGGSLGQPS